jgi:hypothetical protein
MNESVSEIAVKIGDYFHEHRNYLSRMPATIRAYSQQGWDYLSEVAVKAKISIAAQWEPGKYFHPLGPNITLIPFGTMYYYLRKVSQECGNSSGR